MLGYRRITALLAAILLPFATLPSISAAERQSDAPWYADLSLESFADPAQSDPGVRGRPVLLQFWASWCGSCGALMWDLDELAARYSGVTYLAVSIDEDAAAPRDYVARHALFQRHPRRFYWDATSALQRKLEIDTVPVIVLFDATGRERLRHRGHVNSADLQRIRAQLEQLESSGSAGVAP